MLAVAERVAVVIKRDVPAIYICHEVIRVGLIPDPNTSVTITPCRLRTFPKPGAMNF
jgi:hypothetical protein